MADIDYREEIAKADYEFDAPNSYFIWDSPSNIHKGWYLRKADQILRTVIAKGKVCGSCRGGGLIGGSGINDMCFDCHGTGKLKEKTIDDAIKEKLGG